MDERAEVLKALSQNDSRGYFEARKVHILVQRFVTSDERNLGQDVT